MASATLSGVETIQRVRALRATGRYEDLKCSVTEHDVAWADGLLDAIPLPLLLSAALGLAGVAALIAVPSTASAANGGISTGGGGTAPSGQTTAGPTAKLKHGYAIPPRSAPRKVVRAIEAANDAIDLQPWAAEPRTQLHRAPHDGGRGIGVAHVP